MTPPGTRPQTQATSLPWTRSRASSPGRSSPIAEARRQLGKMPAEERPSYGARVNEVTEKVKAVLATRRAELVRLEADRLLQDDRVDVTLEAWTMPAGTEHLIQQTIDEVCEIFIGLGYRVAEGPEAELGWYNFGALNTPPTHPSRLESDTLYLDFGDPADEILLRTQTSPMQARYMEAYEPPVYVVVPGKTYRADAIDASHLPVFHQIEGLAVDSSITLSDLKGTLAYFAREFFGPAGSDPACGPTSSLSPSPRPNSTCPASFAEVPGINCRLCKGSGWLEMAGCGMVDPNVFEAVGYDPASRDRIRVRDGSGADGHGQARNHQHPPLHRQRHSGPQAVPMKVSLRWLADYIELPTQDAGELKTVLRFDRPQGRERRGARSRIGPMSTWRGSTRSGRIRMPTRFASARSPPAGTRSRSCAAPGTSSRAPRWPSPSRERCCRAGWRSVAARFVGSSRPG